VPADIVVPLKGNLIAEYVMETRQPFVSEDLLHDERFRSMWDIQRARDTAAMLIIPVMMGDRVIGTIGLDSATPRSFALAEIELAMTAANQAAVAIEKGRLFTETQQRAAELDAQAQRLALVNRVSTRLAQTLDPQEMYSIVLSELAESLQVQFAGLVLFESDTQGRLVLDYPFDHPTPELYLSLEGNRSIQRVRDTHKPLVSVDVLSDPLFEPAWDVLRMRNTRSLMIVPVLIGDQVVGTIGLDSTVSRNFTEIEMGLAETIASQAALAMEKARLYNETLGLTIFNQAVVESIQQGIVVLDHDLVVRRVNFFMVERYGWAIAAVGQKLFDYRTYYADFLREPIAVALALGQPQVQYEVEHRDENGVRSIRNYYVYPMLEGQRVTGIVLLVEDVTERTLLEADLNTRAVQMAALSEVSSQITSTLDPNQVINLILDALDRVVPYDGVSLWLRAVEREELFIAAARGYQDPDSPDAESLIGLTAEILFSPLFREMAEHAQVINAGNVSAGDPRFPYGTMAVYKNWLGAPLISKGNVVGVLALEKREPNFYTPLHEQLALTFANQAAVALDNAQLFQETRARAVALNQQAQRLALLNRVSLALAQSLDLENIFEIALRETAIALDLPEGSAMQIDIENGLGRVVVEFPRGDAPPEAVFDVTRNEAVMRVRNNLIPLVVERVADDPLAEDLRRMMRRTDIASTLLVPLVVGGEVIGILRLDAPGETRQFTPEQVELAQTIASQAAIAVQNASLFEQTSIRTRELETLFESAQATAVTLDLNEVVRRVTVQMLSALRADACVVFLWDDVNNRLEVRGEISAWPDDVPADQLGDLYNLHDYPLREQALKERELLILRADHVDLPPGEVQLLEKHHAASRMLVPLVVNEISIGLVEVETLDPNRYFRSEDIRLARTLASQAAISIENARLQTETRRTVEELYIINDMSTALSSAASLSELLEVVADQLPNLTDAPVIYVALYDGAVQTISFPLAVREEQPFDLPARPLGVDEFSLVLKRQSPLLLAGEHLDQVRRSLGIETVMPEARCFLGVPLFAGDELIGVLGVRDDQDPMAFSHNDQRILNTVGAQLGVAIQGARLLQQTLQLAEELDRRVRERTAELELERQHISTLYGITTELATSLDMERVLHRALDMVAEAVGATQGAILAIDPITERLIFRSQLGWPLTPVPGHTDMQSMGLDEGLAGWAIQNRQSVIVDDVQADPRWIYMSEADYLPRASMAGLIEANEEILGVIMLYSDQVGAFNQEHLRLVTAASHQVANAMNNAELYSLIRDQAERLGSMLRQEQIEATKSASILDSVADGVVVADSEGQVIIFNSTAERILGIPAGRVLNRPTSVIAGIYGASRWAGAVENWMRDPAAYQPGEFLEERIRLEDERVISMRLSPVHMGDQFLGTVSIFRDITREVEVDRLKSEFVATVSHELRTPMTSIKGYADLLLLGAAGEITEQQQRFLETIKQNADRLSILVNDLLDISRIDQGRIELKFGSVSVEDLLNATATHLNGRGDDEKRPKTIVVDLPEDHPLWIWGDYDKVAQIVMNLADNAFNYTPTGGTITLAAYEDESHTVLSVSDTGIGISPEVADRVFERFFRGDEVQELVMDTPGTGLGLAIVKEYVQMHQGRIWFESEVGQGTTFFVQLPAKAPETTASSA
jgi:PAS domain S-box-containing protein